MGKGLPEEAEDAHTMLSVTAVTPAWTNWGIRSSIPLYRPLFSTGIKDSYEKKNGRFENVLNAYDEQYKA